MTVTKISSEDFILYLKSSSEAKITIIVSKKVAPKAVDRNRIKRLFKEALNNLGFSGYVKIMVNNNIASLKEQQIRQKLEKLFKSK